MIVLFLGTLSDEHYRFINELFEKHHVRFYNISLGILHSHADAEDAVAQSFLRLMDCIDKVSRMSQDQALPYCIIIVKNESFNILRHQKKSSILEETLTKESTELTSDPLDELFSFDKHLKSCLNAAMDALPDQDRYFIHLRFANEMNFKEIAQILGITEDAAKKRGQRIVKKLSQLCKERVNA